MALAHLCAGLQRYDPAKRLFGFAIQPFIVDHNAREGSTEEAQRVRIRLRNMGNSS
jgi:hypothetical protein